MTESNVKSELKAEESETLFSERKKNMELIQNWYQSYYLWNTTYMANFFMHSSIVNYGPRATSPGKFL